MSWFGRLIGFHYFKVTCVIQTDDDHIYGFTIPIVIHSLFLDVSDETVIKKVVKNIVFVKKGIIVKDIKIINCDEIWH